MGHKVSKASRLLMTNLKLIGEVPWYFEQERMMVEEWDLTAVQVCGFGVQVGISRAGHVLCYN